MSKESQYYYFPLPTCSPWCPVWLCCPFDLGSVRGRESCHHTLIPQTLPNLWGPAHRPKNLHPQIQQASETHQQSVICNSGASIAPQGEPHFIWKTLCCFSGQAVPVSPKTFGTKILINCSSLYLPSYSVTAIDQCIFYTQNWKTKPWKKFFHYPQPTFLFCPHFLSL